MAASRKGKAQFYVFYLGWKECRGIRGREFVEPIVRELIERRYNEELPKLTIEATRKELKIMQLIEKKKNKVEKLKYPPIPTKDVTFTIQARSPDEDVVACIYLGYNPQTRAAVHVHVYRCDSPATASMFVDHLASFIDMPDHQERTAKIESELVAKGQVLPASSTYGLAPSETASTRYDPHDDIYDRRPYGSRDNLRDPYHGGGDNLRDGYHNQRDHRDQRDMRDYKESREDPYSLREFRRELNDVRSEPKEHFRNDYRNYDHRNGPADSRPVYNERDQRAGQRPTERPVDPYHEQEDVYQSVTAELKAKLQNRSGVTTAPILLPPQDYDTVRRKGLEGIEERRSRNQHIVGPGAASTDDSSSTYSDRGNNNNRDSYADIYEVRNGGYNQYRDTRGRSPEYRRGGRPASPEPRWNGGHPARAASPEPRGGPRGGERRGRSPNRNKGYRDSPLARAMSPPPGSELRNNYFPSDDVLPNYLAPPGGGGGGYGGYPARAVSPGRRSPRPASPSRSRYSGSDEGRRQQQKYTASSLGLKQGGPPPRAGYNGRPRSDEGYLSMDRDNGHRAYNKDPYDDPYNPPRGGYNARDRDSPPPREVIAGDSPHPELGSMDPNLPGSKQTFLY